MKPRSKNRVKHLPKLMEDAEMLADAKAYDAAKARLENG